MVDVATQYKLDQAGSINTWWSTDPRQRFWLEITDRPDIGVDLHCPQRGSNGVACHVHGTAPRGFLPRAWDHPVASDGTTRRVVPGVLITVQYGCLQVDRLGGSGDGVPGGCRDGDS